MLHILINVDANVSMYNCTLNGCKKAGHFSNLELLNSFISIYMCARVCYCVRLNTQLFGCLLAVLKELSQMNFFSICFWIPLFIYLFICLLIHVFYFNQTPYLYFNYIQVLLVYEVSMMNFIAHFISIAPRVKCIEKEFCHTFTKIKIFLSCEAQQI